MSSMTKFPTPTFWLLLGLALACVSPVLAQSGGNTGGGGAGNGHSNGNGNGQGGGNGNGQSGGNGQGASGQGQGIGDKGKSKSAKASQGAVLDDQASLAAVVSGKAISLEKILAAARSRLQGKIINVRLLQRDGSLVYEIKGLSQGGLVNNLYFHAKSGKPVPN